MEAKVNERIYGILTRNAVGTVLEKRVQNVYDKNNLIRAQEILPNTQFTVLKFDLYTNRALVQCSNKGKIFLALFDFDFLTECCFLDKIDREQIIEAVYLPEKEIDERIKLTRYDFVMGMAGCILLGLVLGGFLSCLM